MPECKILRGSGKCCVSPPYIADYAQQRQWQMRQAFRFIQLIDGRENTRHNADGFIETELSRILDKPVAPVYEVNTLTGTIAIFCEANAGSTIANGDQK